LTESILKDDLGRWGFGENGARRIWVPMRMMVMHMQMMLQINGEVWDNRKNNPGQAMPIVITNTLKYTTCLFVRVTLTYS
jgi:hypothetical protein